MDGAHCEEERGEGGWVCPYPYPPIPSLVASSLVLSLSLTGLRFPCCCVLSLGDLGKELHRELQRLPPPNPLVVSSPLPPHSLEVAPGYLSIHTEGDHAFHKYICYHVSHFLTPPPLPHLSSLCALRCECSPAPRQGICL